jgi:Tfp pilus assembly protein PilN
MREVEFLPEQIRQQRARHRRLLRQGYLLAACVAGMGLLTYVRHGRMAEAGAEVAMLTRRADNLQHQLAMIPALERKLAGLLIKKRIDEKLGSRTDCTAVLAELCRLVPVNMALASMDLKTIEVRVKAAKPPQPSLSRTAVPAAKASEETEEVVRRVRLVLTGLAPTDVDVANFIGQLAACCLFEDVNMGYAKTVDFRGRSAREFQVSCYLAK